MDESKLREKFEGWLSKDYLTNADWDAERNCYKDFRPHFAWQAYQAAYLDGLAEGRKQMNEEAAKRADDHVYYWQMKRDKDPGNEYTDGKVAGAAEVATAIRTIVTSDITSR